MMPRRVAALPFPSGFVACFATVALACGAPRAPDATPVLLFDGIGTSPNDVTAVRALLRSRSLDYATVNTERLNGMSEAELRVHRLLIVPGGNYIAVGKGLTPRTATNVQSAVQGGLNYLGICAGGILAGNVPDGGLNLTKGVRFDFYAVVNRGVHKSAVLVSVAGAPAVEHYWEDGPQFTGWGEVVGKYPDGTPAIVQGRCGKGWVVLVGTHPEAPEGWRRGLNFSTSAEASNAYAGKLVEAALSGTPLPHY